MPGFNAVKSLEGLEGPYPKARVLLEATCRGGIRAREAVARQLLSEGTPYAFREFPGLYDSVRTFIAQRLDVDAKEVSITGSGRLGESLAPKRIGAAFRDASDLDLFIVSGDLFDRLKEDFKNWSADVDTGRISPDNERQAGFWEDTLQRMDLLLRRGFIDAKSLPNKDRYTTAKQALQTASLLKIRLDKTDGAPKVREASIRCYRDWTAFVNQCSINIEAAEKELLKAGQK